MRRRTSPLSAQIAARIIQLIRARQNRAGDHLTEHDFARALDGSRSPVRRAFALLAKRGVLRQEPNRGYFLARDAKLVSAMSLPAPAPAADDLYQRIAEDCLEGRLKREVSEAALVRRYATSRGQLLKVLSRLSREGMIERKPGHGWRFNALVHTAEAHNQSYRFRMAIETAALLEPSYQVDPAAFARAREQQRALLDGGILRFSKTRLFEIGAEFHETIVRCSGNPYFLEALQGQNRLRRFIEYRGNADRRRFARQCHEHLKLLDLIEAGRMQEAAAFLRQHLDVVREIKVGAQPAPPREIESHF